jgi:CubicO group peptidase (beta-lactamase class C family)
MYYDLGGYYKYGYTWWGVQEQPFYEATGHYEQKIYVLPEHDIVVVFTGDIQDEDWHPTDFFVMEYVIPSTEDAGSYNPVFIINTSILVTVILPILIVLARRKLQQ